MQDGRAPLTVSPHVPLLPADLLLVITAGSMLVQEEGCLRMEEEHSSCTGTKYNYVLEEEGSLLSWWARTTGF